MTKRMGQKMFVGNPMTRATTRTARRASARCRSPTSRAAITGSCLGGYGPSRGRTPPSAFLRRSRRKGDSRFPTPARSPLQTALQSWEHWQGGRCPRRRTGGTGARG